MSGKPKSVSDLHAEYLRALRTAVDAHNAAKEARDAVRRLDAVSDEANSALLDARDALLSHGLTGDEIASVSRRR